MSSTKKKLLLNTVSVNLGCSCRRPKLPSIFHLKKKTKIPLFQKHHYYYSSNSSTTTTTNSTWDKTVNYSSSPYMDHVTTTCTPSSTSSSTSTTTTATVDGPGRVGPKSVAVEKESNDPYLDFRQSMLQMIVENQIYSKDDLKELLNCFLQLNSPSLHGVIIRVFTEIWNGFFYAPPKSYQF